MKQPEFVVVPLPEAIMSNDLGQLLEVLIEDIRTSTSPSLLKACVIVPDGALRAWLSHELAKKGISLFRIQLLILEEALEQQPSDTPILSRHHLMPLLMAFFDHLQKTGAWPSRTSDSTESEYHMARRMRLPYAVRAFLGERSWFLKDPIAERLWQQFEAWCPLRIPSVHKPSLSSSQTPLFLFGFSSLNPLLLGQFLSLPALCRLYLLSPCMLFWGDQSSDQEMRFLLTAASNRHVTRPSAEQLEQLLYDRHRLLANSGQVGREFMLLIEEARLQTRSCYVLPEPLVTTPYTDYLLPETFITGKASRTLLDYIKADLLLLVGKRDIPQPLPHDNSIEIHGAPTPLREVEALRERLLACPALPPASVIVLVTDIARYQAAIEQVLGQQIPYQLWGGEQKSGIITACRMLIHLLMSKGTLHDWLQLLRHPVFQKALLMSKEEAEALIEWLATKEICWGLSAAHRHRYLASRAIIPSDIIGKSFEEEKDCLLATLLTTSLDESAEVSLLGAIGSFFQCITAIEDWWQLPLQQSSYAPMSCFATLIDTIVDMLLKGSSGGYEEEALTAATASFTQIAAQTASPQLPASEALHLFYTLVDTHLSRHFLRLSSPIIVAEFGSFQPFPAHLIAILGAHEGALPEHSEEQLLKRLDRMVPKIPASNTFFDRYAFLEVMLAAENIFISYQSYAFDIKETVPYSPIVADLLYHIDTNYTVNAHQPSTLLHVTHPLARPQHQALPSTPPSPALHLEKPLPSSSVTISSLQYAARSPLDLYYKEHYSFSSPRFVEESLFIKPWEIRAHLERDIAAITPSHTHPSYKKAHSSLHATLRAMDITPQPFDLHLLPTMDAPHSTPTALFAPLIPSSPSIIGSWKGLVTQGIILTSEQWQQELFSRWPENAIRTYLVDHHRIPFVSQAILVKECRTIPLPPSPCICDWAAFSALAATTPFPFTFDIIKLLLTHPTPHDVLQAIIAHAEEKRGPWPAFAAFITADTCATLLPQWEHYATLLWSDLFTLLETP